MALAETIGNLDRKLFLILNRMHTPQLDYLMTWMSNEFIWIPFYAALLGLTIYFFRKKSWILIAGLIVMVVVSDQGSGLIKRSVKRYRPCHNTEIAAQARTINGCGGKYGFVSSHAANTFALATFMSLLMVRKYEYFALLMFCWASVVSYSRIYLGVHYPLDIAGGAFVGIVTGYALYKTSMFFLKNDLTPESIPLP